MSQPAAFCLAVMYRSAADASAGITSTPGNNNINCGST
jgi:hypothetical protein